jgi:hypothetical protein
VERHRKQRGQRHAQQATLFNTNRAAHPSLLRRPG